MSVLDHTAIESSSYHHFTSLAGRAGERQKSGATRRVRDVLQTGWPGLMIVVA
jgi:hypothetical protein